MPRLPRAKVCKYLDKFCGRAGPITEYESIYNFYNLHIIYICLFILCVIF